MSLRGVLLALGTLLLVAALVSLFYEVIGLTLWLTVNGLALTLGIGYERWRYKANRPQRPDSRWQATGERFVDPASGRLVQVYYDPASGERSYVEVGQA